MEESIIWLLICGVIGGFIYQSKNRPFQNGFLWGLLLGVLGVIITICKNSYRRNSNQN